MTDTGDFRNGDRGVVDELFDEYLDRWVEGAPPPEGELERLAGPHAEELRDRLALMRDLSELSAILGDGPEVPQRPERVAHYQVLGELGEGGLSCVYLAEDTKLKRKVALKVLDTRALGAKARELWMPQEAQLLARLEHESVVRVTDVGEADDVSYMVMEHVQGPSLATLLKALRKAEDGQTLETHASPVAEAAAHYRSIAARCRLVMRLASALDACHREGVVHRDVKPANVLLDRDHVPKLIDFGLASAGDQEHAPLTAKGDYGTRAYLAPELTGRGNHGADAASDQYSLGVVLYQLLTLQLPHEPREEHERWRAVTELGIRPPRELRRDIPPDVERICMHCLERSPRNRYPSMAALAADLRAFLDYRAISLEEPGLWRRTWLLVRRRPLHAALTGLVVVVVCGVLAQLALLGVGRARLLNELEQSLSAGLAAQRPEQELAIFFNDVVRARESARRFDEPILAGLLLGGTDAPIDSLWEQGSRELHDRLDEAFATATGKHSPQANDLAYANLLGQVGWTLQLEELASPGGSCGRELHRIGTVELPPGARLLGYVRDGFPYFPEFEPADPGSALVKGLYRVCGDGPTGAFELDVVGLPSTPRRRIPEPRFPPDLLGRLVPHGGRVILETTSRNVTPTALLELEKTHYRVSPVRISTTPCTWADLERALGEEEVRPVREFAAMILEVEPDAISPDEPAVVPWFRAHQCVTAFGARLPTAAELWSAIKSGDVVPVEGSQFEWTSGFPAIEPEDRLRLLYPTKEDLAEDRVTARSVPNAAWMPGPSTVFRFVLPPE